MPLNKQAIPINFAKGLDTKTDPYQVGLGNFLSLENSVFTKAGLLQKRNGFASLPALPDTTSTLLTTFNGNLTAIGTELQAYSQSEEAWVNKGNIQPIELSTLPVIRSNTNQSQADLAMAPNGLVCVVYTDNVPVSGTLTPIYKYVVIDSTTGQNIVAPTVITSTGPVLYAPRVFTVGNYFAIVFGAVIASVNHLQYIAINTIKPTVVTAATDISTVYTPASTLNFDGYVANSALYLAWNGSDGSIKMTYLNHALAQSNTVSFSGHQATIMSVTADITGTSPVIYASFYDSASSTGFTVVVNNILQTLSGPTAIITAETVNNITSAAQNGVASIFYEILNFYGYDGSIQTDYINTNTITQAGVVGSETTIDRSIGLASKAFIVNGVIYMLSVYSSPYQPTYFLIDAIGNVISKLAYSNGGTYDLTGLPSVTVNGDVATMPYLYKDLIEAINKSLAPPSAAAVYSQTGVNLVNFTITTSNIITAEIGNDLLITGGFLWQYDGYLPVEQGFHLWPDYVEATTSTTGGALIAQEYFYQATYEWSDNQGNVYRSAPSIPIAVTTTGSTSANTIYVPTCRLTYKIANPVKICIYRWSTAQQIFYQVTSITVPILNSTTVDYITYVDTQSDAAILGNNILYTTGGVLEDIGGPASSAIALFNNRLFLVDAEDPNLLWFSKEVIEATPVEMSDLLTIYVAPTTSAQGSTGPTLALSALDDKLVLFKNNAIYYINGIGPDNTGANSQYSDAIFITSTVGCSNQHSIVFMPSGLMFQSDKGIWLLGRDLSSSYIGAPVESFTQNAKVLSAVNIPATNQVRFTLDSGVTLMYDYYYGQWGTFVNIPAISSTLYQNLHTYLDIYGRVAQESAGVYLDPSGPVLMQFTTSWLNLAGLQGFERAYFFYLLGTYLSPHKLTVDIAYDYNSSPTQSTTISPDNFAANWGGEQLWGSGQSWGGNGNIEQWRVFLKQQKCSAFQISIQESYDPSFGIPAGAGLTMSGIDLVVGQKSGYPRLKAARQVG